MHTIQVDEEVYRTLEKMVTGFGDTPNQVLRRFFNLGEPRLPPSQQPQRHVKRTTGKAPKTNLRDLIAVGSLREGQTLYLHDYQGNKLPGIEAVLKGNQLEFGGQFYSLSALTKQLMQQQGYQSDSYRGPKFWCTRDGRSVSDLWDEYTKAGMKKSK